MHMRLQAVHKSGVYIGINPMAFETKPSDHKIYIKIADKLSFLNNKFILLNILKNIPMDCSDSELSQPLTFFI